MRGGDKRATVCGAVACLAAGTLAMPAHARVGSARCWVDKGALVVPAAFGDIAGDFLIDPATPNSLLHVTRAQSAGIETGAATRTLVVAGRRIPAFSMRVADLDGRTRDFDTTINGVIGADLLERFTVDIDWRPCRIRLWRDHPGVPAGATRLSLRAVDGRGLVPAFVSDGVAVRADGFAIDTSRWASLITDAHLSRPEDIKPGEAAEPVRLRALELAGRLFEQVPAAVPANVAEREPSTIGLAVWSRWRMRLDLGDGWLAVSPMKGHGQPPSGF
jgi:hypothetical protein